MPSILLVDNGSRRPQATRRLRRLAEALAGRLQSPVHPVSLLHASAIPAASLDGQPADTFEPFLRQRVADGDRRFLVVPLFFGPSRAITDFIPERSEAIAADMGEIQVDIADVLCPLPSGEPRLIDILLENVRQAAPETRAQTPSRIVLVDHGSPQPAVTAVRAWLREGLARRLGERGEVAEAVMERRSGARYDFNGMLLEEMLEDIAQTSPACTVTLAMQFLLPGRHAGSGGDIDQICDQAMARHPGLRVTQSALVGDHPLLIDILESRAATALRDADGKRRVSQRFP
jgi:sirohydrochlorin ferrochelatase